MAQRWSFAEWEQATLVLVQRQRGRCARCWKGLNNDGVRHHRKRRRDGGDALSNVVLLHDACHRWVHANPAEARGLGLIVPFAADVLAWPLAVQGGGWVTLDDSGGAAVSLGSGGGQR